MALTVPSTGMNDIAVAAAITAAMFIALLDTLAMNADVSDLSTALERFMLIAFPMRQYMDHKLPTEPISNMLLPGIAAAGPAAAPASMCRCYVDYLLTIVQLVHALELRHYAFGQKACHEAGRCRAHYAMYSIYIVRVARRTGWKTICDRTSLGSFGRESARKLGCALAVKQPVCRAGQSGDLLRHHRVLWFAASAGRRA